MGGAQWLAYLLTDPAAPSSIPSIKRMTNSKIYFIIKKPSPSKLLFPEKPNLEWATGANDDGDVVADGDDEDDDDVVADDDDDDDVVADDANVGGRYDGGGGGFERTIGRWRPCRASTSS